MVWFNLMPYFNLSFLKTNEFLYVLLFVLFVAILIVFVKKMDGTASSVHLNRDQIPAQSMVRLRNPFKFRVCDESLRCDNYRSGVKLAITSDSSFWVFAYWAADIQDLHYAMAEDWQPMRQLLLDHKFIDGHYLFRAEPDLYYETNEQIIHWVKPPTDYFSGESLGYNPRTRYPLVVIIVRNDDDDGVEINDTDVVCMVSIIHLRDTFCTTTTSLITQYLKQRSGHMFDLKQLFAPQGEAEPEGHQFCVICQARVVSHALLPCRHTCLCGQCLQRVDTCPICRTPFTSFFRVGDSDAEDSDADDEQIGHKPNTGWFASINSKLNQWLGMH